ncbi:MAG TPA: ParB/RepB/Spo0J family partition protein [Gemmatimonadales bacterium]|nr:ParB/RepB/Spo0J family partition protein [Gemmatimonadales bacterium]
MTAVATERSPGYGGRTMTPPELVTVPIEQLHPHPANRKRFNQAELAALAEDLKANGQMTPALVRQLPDGQLQLLAGERRWRAAKLAGLGNLLCIVREVSDLHALSMLARENNQREDVHPMEEAELYEAFTKMDSLTQERIAKLVGRDPHYVRDRLQLLKMIPAARKLFLEDRFTVKHAILLARLTKEHQERAIDPENAVRGWGLFERDGGLFEQADFNGKADTRKAVSVPEFQHWIDDHCRLDTADPLLPELFPETAAALEQAQATDAKVVHITYDHMPSEDAKDDKVRTIGAAHWKRADGELIAKHGYNPSAGRKSKTCAHSVLGIVAAGPDRGRSFLVCIDKKGCDVHWKRERQERAQAAKRSSRSGGGNTWEAQQKKREEQEARDRLEGQRWKKALPQIGAAMREKLGQASAKSLSGQLLKFFERGDKAFGPMDPGSTAESLVRALAYRAFLQDINTYWEPRLPVDLRAIGKTLGIDVKAIVDKVSPPEKPKAEAKPAKKLAGDVRRAQAAKAKRKK